MLNHIKIYNKISISIISVFFSVVIILSISGVVCHYAFNYLPSTAIFEALFVLLCISCLPKISKKMFFYFFSTVTYVLISFIYACIYRNVHVLDFFQAFKSFYYIFFLTLTVGNYRITSDELYRLFRIILYFSFIKYSYYTILGLSNRPGLFIENNFELVFLILLYYLVVILGYNKKSDFILTALIFILSGSRSGIIMFAYIYFIISVKKGGKYFIFRLIIFSILAIVAVLIIISRMGVDSTVEDIDRYKFLMMFINDTKDWRLFDFIVGAPRLTAMSSYVAEKLSFYKPLFSYKNDGTCYSVILHSFILRVIFDHGILGLIYIINFLIIALKASYYKTLDILAVVGVILLTSFSVSSMNNVFVVLILLLYFTYKRDQGGHDESYCNNSRI